MDTKLPCKSCGKLKPKSELVTKFYKYNCPGRVFVFLKRCQECEAKARVRYQTKKEAKA